MFDNLKNWLQQNLPDTIEDLQQHPDLALCIQ